MEKKRSVSKVNLENDNRQDHGGLDLQGLRQILGCSPNIIAIMKRFILFVIIILNFILSFNCTPFKGLTQENMESRYPKIDTFKDNVITRPIQPIEVRWGKVRVNSANLRSGPGINYRI